jgi:nucleotidyltransferase/DNA polymerase involved in DNA repair
MAKVEFLSKDAKLQSLETLAQIWGVGPSGALKLYNHGIQNIQQLREKGQHILTKLQIIGLKYHEDIIQKMPREEAFKISEKVKETATILIKKKLIVHTCGSYRRGK